MSEKWYSTDEEHYQHDEIEDAIELQLESDTKVGDTVSVWEGERSEVRPRPNASWLIEHMQEAAYEEVGEYAEDWLTNTTSIQDAELQSELDSLIDNWLEAHKLAPTFFAVKNAKEVGITITKLSEHGEFDFERVGLANPS